MLNFYYVYSARILPKNGYTEHHVRLYLVQGGELIRVGEKTDMFTGEMQIVRELAQERNALPVSAYGSDGKVLPIYTLEQKKIANFTSL